MCRIKRRDQRSVTVKQYGNPRLSRERKRERREWEHLIDDGVVFRGGADRTLTLALPLWHVACVLCN